MRKISFLLIIFITFLFVLPKITQAGNASLYLSPASSSFFVGSTFDVSVFVNTGGENINAIEVNLKFDPTKIQVASPTAGKSFIEVWVAQPTFSNTQGTMSFIGGVPSPGINTSAGLVSTVTFRAITPGETQILFLDSSKVLKNDPQGVNILTSMNRGVYTLLIPPPEGPKVFSSTHSDQNKWYKNNNPTFSWDKEEGVTGFSFNIDQDPMSVPDNDSEGGMTSISFSEIGDGVWYFHVKGKKADIWGGTSTYPVKIDLTPPASFTPTIQPSEKTVEKQPLISFFSTDAVSGMDYYQIKCIDITPDKAGEEAGFFTEASGPYKLPALAAGKYLVVVRAYDIAGNWREGNIKIEILSKEFFFTKDGINFRGFLIPWWILILILIIIILLIMISFLIRYRRLKRREREKLSSIEKNLEIMPKDKNYVQK